MYIKIKENVISLHYLKIIILPLSLVLLFYYLTLVLLLRRVRASAHRIHESKIEPIVSIIVAVHNGGKNVLKCLDALDSQDYPRSKYEIIVVDDQSTDGTFERLKFAKMHPISVLQNSQRGKYKSAKKSALELGISRAHGDILLFTDADCQPANTWIKGMVAHFDGETGLVAGFSPQIAAKKLLSDLLTLDAGAAAFVAAAAIASGRGITCSGRNLAYRKAAFIDADGFAAAPDSLSGDDDFMLQAISRQGGWKVRYAFASSTIVPSVGPESLRSFLHQKRRHISAGKYFPRTAQAGFVLFNLANALVWISAFIGCLWSPLLLLPLLLKFSLDYLFLRWFLLHFSVKIYWPSFLLWELLYFYYNCVTGLVGLLKKERW